jgi:hypothetical protein
MVLSSRSPYSFHQAAQNDLPTRPQVKNTPEAYPLGYVEDVFKSRTQLEIVFSSLLEIPGDAAQERPRTPWHKVNVGDGSRLVA